MDTLILPSPTLNALALDLNLNVVQRLTELRGWLTHWQAEDHRLLQQIESLNPNSQADVLRGSQIGSLRRQLSVQITQQPIDLDPEMVQRIGFTKS